MFASLVSLAMTRKKVKLAFITNDSARKATYKKRKKGLLKKVSELSTLCGVDACAIVYSPYESEPEVWPGPVGVQLVISRFKRMPEMEQSKKMVNQEGFIKHRIAKANEQLRKQCKENREKEMTEVMYQCLTGRGIQDLMMADLHDLGWLVDQNVKKIEKRIEFLKKMAPPQQAKPPTTPPGEPSMPVDGIPRTGWFNQWMNNPGQNKGSGSGNEMTMKFHENHNFMWSSAFFP